jgi:hypothetical protein
MADAIMSRLTRKTTCSARLPPDTVANSGGVVGQTPEPSYF